LADLSYGHASSTLVREDGRRVTTVYADVVKTVITGQQVNARLLDEVLPKLRDQIPGLSWTLGGEQREQRQTLPSLARNFVLAVFGMYAMLALAFRNYVQPFIVIASIPFGLVGATIGHLLMGLSFGL
ncbi:MAG: efflux RND transporter permease subunit, partial [Quisquiliibacterium sp.]